MYHNHTCTVYRHFDLIAEVFINYRPPAVPDHDTGALLKSAPSPQTHNQTPMTTAYSTPRTVGEVTFR